MKNQFNKQNLEKLGIFELRNVAREIGVHSPTIYKKEQLIEDILLIAEGKKEPHIAKNKQGRPPKFIHGVNNILDIFIPKTAMEKQDRLYDVVPYDMATLSKLTAMDSSDALMQYETFEQEKGKGIIEVVEERYAFCYEKGYRTNILGQNFFIASALVASYNLKSGDIVEGYVKKISDEKPYVMYKIEKINNVPVTKFNLHRKEFDNLIARYPNEKLMLNDCVKTINCMFMSKYLPIGKGQRVLLSFHKSIDTTSLVTYFLNEIVNDEKIFKKCILIEERPEDVSEYRSLLKDTEIIYTSADEEPYQALQKLELMMEQAKRLVEENKDVIVFLSSINKLLTLYRKNFIMSHQGLENQDHMYGLAMVKKLLSNARKTEDAGTLTITAFMEESMDESIKLELKDLCNMYVVLDEKKCFKQNKIWFDVLKSEIRKPQLLLSEQEYKEQQEFKTSLTEENVEEQTRLLEQKLLKQLK